MIAVIDTNFLLASIPPQSVHYSLYRAFKKQQFEWLISNEIMAEYEEKRSDIYFIKTASLVLSILSVAPNVIFDEPYFKWNLVNEDADDNKFVDLAVAGNADYLITNDRHFNILKSIEFPKVNVITLENFISIIK